VFDLSNLWFILSMPRRFPALARVARGVPPALPVSHDELHDTGRAIELAAVVAAGLQTFDHG
jgi:hypothetical protein